MNDIFNTRADANVNTEFSELDALFADAREAEPSIADSNFTKVVVNSLPAKPSRRRSRRGLSFDFIGVFLGLAWAYFYFDVSQLLGGILNAVPETIVVSPYHAVIALATVSLVSIAAWWTVENSSSL